jgi:ribosomal protein L32
MARNQPELAMPGLMEEVKKKVNRPVPDLPLSDDTDILIQTPAPLAATATATERPRPRPRPFPRQPSRRQPARGNDLNESVAHFQLDAPTCPNCGHVAVRNGACYKCLLELRGELGNYSDNALILAWSFQSAQTSYPWIWNLKWSTFLLILMNRLNYGLAFRKTGHGQQQMLGYQHAKKSF